MEEYNWVQYAAQHQPQQARPLEIKVEPSLDSTSFSLISPPSSPSAYPGPRSASGDPGPFPAPIRRRSNNSIASPKRAKPYPILTRELRLRTEESGAMGHQPYDTWSPTSMRDVSPSRSSSEGGDQRTPSSYTLSNALVSPQSLSVPHIDTRPQSASSNMTTSSLTGAMGDTHISANSCSPSPTDGPAYNMQRVAWDADQAHAPVAQHHYSTNHAVNRSHEPNMQYREAPSSGSMPNTSYTPFDYHHHTSESISPRSGDLPSLYSDSQQYSYHPVRPHPTIQTRSLAAPEPSDPYETISPMSPDDPRPPPQWNSHEQYEEEIQFLQRKVRELELINESARLRQKDLERELAKDLSGASQSQSHVSSSSSHGLPSPILTPSPQTAGFHASWQARTEARVRHFCSLNRAGNALCAWHDSRRERRAYPPRMAPPGRLNCGCTHAEALFEESLSRHGVGSYHPGESVRMDPALRNPLLKLLQTRYGYRDGDFERDITTGEWVEGEGHSIWEHNAITGVPAYRKK
ncbi:hypothetical protein FIBSPDRAFT_927769 [Athelia psychrophila]|uniref:Uncharacterized protein n=1 Tax=Athelia psychrophila TaxID=1759441 RepID=A0A166RB54_9AGAM|nr:hypothetical protein FIBSPDRAFT_927769 [Fibularhizoctonia sp. CBS 109695]